MRNVALNGPVVASAATADGHGYYMVGSDGGIFSFGDARFHGSMGGAAPERSRSSGSRRLPTVRGYWLVASDGGVFAFDAPFRGSMGARHLNRPVIGHGRVRERLPDGRVRRRHLRFSDKPFFGSLAATPPAAPIVGVAVYG